MFDFRVLLNNVDSLTLINIILLFSLIIRSGQLFNFQNINFKSRFFIFILLIDVTTELTLLQVFNLKSLHDPTPYEVVFLLVLLMFMLFCSVILVRSFKITFIKKQRNIKFLIIYLYIVFLPRFLDGIFGLHMTFSYAVIGIFELLSFLYVIFLTRRSLSKNFLNNLMIIGSSCLYLLLKIFVLFNDFFTIDEIAQYDGGITNIKLIINLLRTIVLVVLVLVGLRIVLNYKSTNIGIKEKPYNTNFFKIIYPPLIVIIIIGLNYFNMDNSEKIREHFRAHVEVISTMLDVSQVQNLNGNIDDLESPDYQSIHNKFINFMNQNSDYRYLYLYALNDNNQVVNYVEAESDINSVEEGAYDPGDIYDEPSEVMLDSLNRNVSNFEGPLKDEFGFWYSNFEPIQTTNGKKIILGMDMFSSVFQRELFHERNIIVVLILFMIFIDVVSDDLLSGNQILIREYKLILNRFKLLFGLYTDPIIIIENNIIIECNTQAVDFFKTSRGSLLGSKIIDHMPHFQSENIKSSNLFEEYLSNLEAKKISRCEWKFNINGKIVDSEITIVRLQQNALKSYQILIHDITDRKKVEEEKLKHIHELESLNRLMIGRELKMIELKRQIKDLENKTKNKHDKK